MKLNCRQVDRIYLFKSEMQGFLFLTTLEDCGTKDLRMSRCFRPMLLNLRIPNSTSMTIGNFLNLTVL